MRNSNVRRFRQALGLTLAVCMLAAAGAAAADQTNPIIFPTDTIRYQSYPDTIVNILLLGIDFGREGHWGSMYKKDLRQCHTDAMLVVAVNITKNKIDIISIPRDTMTIVPGVRGVYKLNGAVNCGDTLAEGLDYTVASIEKLLGGIKISGYIAVDMNAMVELGDAMGGVDYKLDMGYVGSSGRQYDDVYQHLDGTGIMDYVRARTNATIDASDHGRTRRQREMMTAVIQKLLSDSKSAMNVLGAMADAESGVYTNISGTDAVGLLALIPLMLKTGDDIFTSYTLQGDYKLGMQWMFTFTDQEYRAEVIKTVYGFDAEPLKYVSRKHAEFYQDWGFYTVFVVNIVNEFIDGVKAMNLKFTPEQQALWDAFMTAYEETLFYFNRACEDLVSNDITEMKYARVRMRDLADEVAKAIGYEKEFDWTFTPKEWYKEPYVNQYQYDWR